MIAPTNDRDLSSAGLRSRVVAWLSATALWALALVLALGAIAFLRLLGLGGILIVAGLFFVYLIMPLVNRLRSYGPLWVALLITFLLFAAAVVVAALTILPPLGAQARSLIDSLPSTATMIQHELESDRTLPIPGQLRDYILGLPAQLQAFATRYGFTFAQQTLGTIFSFVSVLLSLMIVPILTIYFFFDGPEAKRSLLGFIPERSQPKALAIAEDVNEVLGAFVRGQVLDGFIVGFMVGVMLWALHVPYALLIGVAAGVLNFVPYLGAIAGVIPAVTLAFAFNGWQNALLVGLLFGTIQQIDGNLILPRIMKANVQLPPLIIVLSIIVFSALFGLMGTFLAVPVAAMLRVIKVHFAPAPGPSRMERIEQEAHALRHLS